MKLQEFLNDLCFKLYVSQKQCLCGEILNKQISDRIADKSREASAADSILEHYSHAEGWSVEGFDTRQWLLIRCLKCNLSWSLDKLGIPRSAVQSLSSTTQPLGNR